MLVAARAPPRHEPCLVFVTLGDTLLEHVPLLWSCLYATFCAKKYTPHAHYISQNMNEVVIMLQESMYAHTRYRWRQKHEHD